MTMYSYGITFASVEIVYIVIAIYIALKTNKNIGTINEVRYFRMIECGFVVAAYVQILWGLDFAGIIDFSVAAAWVVNLGYFLALSIIMYSWFRFIAEKVSNAKKCRLNEIAVRIQNGVLIIHMILILSSLKTGWLLYIDADGTYYRGPYYFLSMICCYSHWVWAVILLINGQKGSSRIAKKQLRTQLLISLLPVVGGILQTFWYEVPFIESSIVLSILFMFTILQGAQIRTDALTRLSNRGEFEQAYERMLLKADVNPFVIFVADIDGFKKINDTRGHSFGDSALICVANGLRNLGERYPKIQLFRYGGDEFVILGLQKDLGDLDAFCEEINAALDAQQEEENLGTAIRFSVGYQPISDSNVDGNKAFNRADEMLYRNKKKKIA